jgi:hypothetical protein
MCICLIMKFVYESDVINSVVSHKTTEMCTIITLSLIPLSRRCKFWFSTVERFKRFMKTNPPRPTMLKNVLLVRMTCYYALRAKFHFNA